MSFVGTALNLTNNCSIRHFERSEAESKSVMGKLVIGLLETALDLQYHGRTMTHSG